MSKNPNLSGGLFAAKKPQALTIKETPLSALFAEYLQKRRIYTDRLNSGKVQVVKTHYTKSGEKREYRNWVHLCEEGTPDRFAIVHGVIVFIEVKQKDKKPTIEQLAKHQELRRAGAIVIVADSFDDFVRQFGDVERNIKKQMQPGVV